MRKILVWFLLVLLLTSCNIGDESSMYGDLISQIKEYQTNAEQPIDIINLETTKDNFDINHYFKLCKHIELMDGWKLDYFYYQEFMRGFPIVYAYEVKNKQTIDYNLFYTYSEDEGLMTQEVPNFILENNFMDYIILDGSEEGYIEYAILELVGPQFLLYWHASYNDHTIVESERHMEVS